MRKPEIAASRVISRDRRSEGRVCGRGHMCRAEGCGGWSLPVRWGNGRLTWICSKSAAIRGETWRLT